jgi:hypothetical protein
MKSLPCRIVDPERRPLVRDRRADDQLDRRVFRISLSLRARAAAKAFREGVARSGSFAKNATSCPPPHVTASTWPLMWP